MDKDKDLDLYREQKMPRGLISGIKFDILNEAEIEKMSVLSIVQPIEVSDPKLGFPNLSSECATCGGKSSGSCEGHYGMIKFPCTILHPYFTMDIVKVLNKVCPGCKAIRKVPKVKGGATPKKRQHNDCKYCGGGLNLWYPPMKFRVSSKDLFKRTTIVVEVSDVLPQRFKRKGITLSLPKDYWDFIPQDSQQEDDSPKDKKRILTHAQIHYLLTGIDPSLIKEHISKLDSVFLNSSIVTPNSHRITEVTHAFSNGQKLIFDERTRAYKKLVDFRGRANDLGSRFTESLKISKLSTYQKDESQLSSESSSAARVTGLKWMKEVILGKRTDHSFRMVVVGDPNIRLSEIGIPCHVADRLQIFERINPWNWGRLSSCCELQIIEKGELYVRRNGIFVRVQRLEDCRVGDTIRRPLNDGDIVLVNRPPSIHQHSLIALSVRVLPINSVISINPLSCLPFRGDFDGDCLHGYIPQSLDSRVELEELVSLDKQLINSQNGKNLISLSQDSLTAAHMIMEDEILLDPFQIHQLAMFSPRGVPYPAIIKATYSKGHAWTGKQLFSMLLPGDFDYSFPVNGIDISKGDLVCFSRGSYWLQNSEANLYHSLIKHNKSLVLNFLYDAQELLCEWLSSRGLSVSLRDLYISHDSYNRKNMIEEVQYGLQEAEQRCLFQQLMVECNRDFLTDDYEDEKKMVLDMEHLFCEKQKSAALCQASVYAFKQVFRDIQNLTYQYASKDNSLLSMVKAGSKGNLLRLVQHGMCLGLQHSLVPLSFRFPHQLSCAAWNELKEPGTTPEVSQSYIPYAIVESSYLRGLNPLECFVHSVANRESSFSDNAEVPGTLTRKLMYFMRDVCIAYDGTVRNAYGNQLVQFSYNGQEDTSASYDDMHEKSGNCLHDAIGGQPVGSMAACALSEAAYSALDQPISVLETSPLLNLKNALDSGASKCTGDQTISLFLSEKLRRHRYGYEHGALGVKSHLERLLFSDIVSSVQINYLPEKGPRRQFNPWVCHFHIRKEIVKRKELKVHAIIDALLTRCKKASKESKISLPSLDISSKDCSTIGLEKDHNNMFCISVAFSHRKTNPLDLNAIRDVVIPFFLETIIKGFSGIKKVEILWKDSPDESKTPGELFLKVSMLGDCGRKKFWNVLMDHCIPIVDLIDWKRSHPDNVYAMCQAYGIDAACKLFLNLMKSAVSDIGKRILPEHLVLVTNSLSHTGEFVGLNARGLAKQKEGTSINSPFVQACFSAPATTFVKAAKEGVVDDLQGSLDALAWGKEPPLGTGGQFEIIYSGERPKVSNPTDIYGLLGSHVNFRVQVTTTKLPKVPSTTQLRTRISLKDIERMYRMGKFILQKYEIDELLSERDRDVMMMALRFHPRHHEKFGTGAQEIKVGYHSEHENSRCFLLVRTDGSVEDFSYRKCVLGALNIIAPRAIKLYQSKWLKSGKE